MVRSLYSGVTGMKAHQTRLDVIGNNIANVNTFGFKSSSVTFRDVYYQTLRGAAGGDGVKGGQNASQVGYGATVGSIDLNMSQSINSTTGRAWDVSIAGEGYFQVQDADGNIYYTRAGKLGYDNNGNLIDANGNFVLGTSGNPLGQDPGSSRIQMVIPSLNPTRPSATNSVDNVVYALTASNASEYGNVTFNILSDDLDVGVKAKAVVKKSGITVTLNNNHTFERLSDLNDAINAAIKEANGGKDHPGGTFTLSMSDEAKFANGLTGREIAEADTAPTLGKLPAPTDVMTHLGFRFSEDPGPVGDGFLGSGVVSNFKISDSYDATATNPKHEYTVSITVGTAPDARTYTRTFAPSDIQTNTGNLILQGPGGVAGDTIILKYPTEKNLLEKMGYTDADAGAQYGFDFTTLTNPDGTPMSNAFNGNATATKKATNLGLTSQPFNLKGGTAGGPQTLEDVSGFKIGADGVLSCTHQGKVLELGRIDLVTFMNPSGLEQVGNTYFAATGNSGDPSPVEAGTSGSGGLVGSSLEMSNVDLSSEFADMITTQRGFQANSRMITVSDTLLEELINLKR